MKIKWFVGSAVSVAAMSFSLVAHAQEAGAAGKEVVPESGALADIVVTAQRRAQNMQDVPIAISVVTAASIENSGYKGLTDIQYLAPSVQYDPASGGGFQVRGVGTQVFDFSTEQAVGVVVDDVVYDLPRNPGVAGLADIERVEVLRGPQGTLFGKNASAGVISVVTKKPVLKKLEGDFSASLGERLDRRITGNLNIPLGDIAALRVSAFETGQHGLGRYTLLDKRMGDVSDRGVRAKLLVAPSSTLEFVVTADYSTHWDNIPLGTLRSVTIPAYGPSAAGAGAAATPDNLNNGDRFESFVNFKTGGVSLSAKLDLGNHSLTSITAYRKLDYTSQLPLDFEPNFDFLPYNVGTISASKLSQELRLASPGNGPIRYVFGLYYNRLDLDSTQEQAGRLGGTLPPGVYLSTTNGIQHYTNRIESEAAFANFNIELAKGLELVLGGRFTHDDNRSATSFDGTTPLGYVAIPISPVPPSPGGVSKSNFSYKISPTYKIGEDIMIYASYATGYKGPGVAYISGLKQPYNAETVKSYEAGIKSEFLDRKVRLNIAAFLQNYTNFQAQDLRLVNGAPAFLVINAGGLRSKGVEAELNVRATKALSFNGSVTYADSVFTDYLRGGVQLAGARLTNAPRLSAVLDASLDQHLGDAFMMHANVGVSYRSKTFQVVANPASIQKSYALANARLAFGPTNEKWQIGIYARNIFNQEFSTLFDALPFGNVRGVSSEARRTVGGFASVKF